MQELEKRSGEQVRYDIDCSLLLSTGETITTVSSVGADANDQSALTFGTPVVNTQPIAYVDIFGDDAHTAPTGTVIQVQIGGGSIASDMQVQEYVIRAKFVTNINPVVEATVRLRLNDTPPV